MSETYNTFFYKRVFNVHYFYGGGGGVVLKKAIPEKKIKKQKTPIYTCIKRLPIKATSLDYK